MSVMTKPTSSEIGSPLRKACGFQLGKTILSSVSSESPLANSIPLAVRRVMSSTLFLYLKPMADAASSSCPTTFSPASSAINSPGVKRVMLAAPPLPRSPSQWARDSDTSTGGPSQAASATGNQSGLPLVP